MNVIKLSTATNDYFPLNRKAFEKRTGINVPFYSEPENPQKSRHYAVCPACDNPVQIIGLYKQSAHTDKPYAKHYSANIKDLAIYVQSNYDFCPFSNKRISNSNKKRDKNNLLTNKIIKELVTHFDKVIY